MRVARYLLIAHGVAVGFALLGILVALPHPEIWSSWSWAGSVFSFGMNYAGSLHVVLGAAAMLAFGAATLGWRRTLIFFVASVGLSLGSELVGTGTGWPFGNYEYTSGLGYKVLGRVPFSIPLSWFYIGLSSYLLGGVILSRREGRLPVWAPVALGAYFLTVWDLVLDPAMAHPSLPIQFWVWHETGPYLGMPLQNFAGWTLTGVLFMAVSRWLWRGEAPFDRIPSGFPFAVYALNMIFAIALSANVGLFGPIVLATLLGIVPACLVWRREAPRVPDAHAIS